MQPDLQHLSPKRKYLIGVSGGRDSVSLLHYLHASGFRKLIVCHLDHSLRSRQSTADAHFVRRLAASYDLPFESAKTRVGTLAKQQKLSIEAAARRARHEFFADLSGTHRCRQILLGHHADDRVETTLLNLFRGSGKLTLPKSPSEIRVGRRTLTFIRPLYPVWRDEVDEYIATHGIKFREDTSNASLDHLRNRIRHQLVPLLTKIFDRDVTKIINRAALIAGEEDAYLSGLVGELDLAPDGRPSDLSTTRLAALPLALQRRAVHAWLRQNSVPKITFELVDQCLALLDAQNAPAKLNLPGGRHVRRKNKTLFVES